MSVAIGEFITTSEAAEILDVSPGRVRQFVIGKRLHPTKIGTLLFFKRKEVQDFGRIKRHEGRPRSAKAKKPAKR